MFPLVKVEKASEMCYTITWHFEETIQPWTNCNYRYLAVAQVPMAFHDLPNFHLCFYNLIDKKQQGKIFSSLNNGKSNQQAWLYQCILSHLNSLHCYCGFIQFLNCWRKMSGHWSLKSIQKGNGAEDFSSSKWVTQHYISGKGYTADDILWCKVHSHVNCS